MVYLPDTDVETGCIAVTGKPSWLHGKKGRRQAKSRPLFLDRSEVTVAAYRACIETGAARRPPRPERSNFALPGRDQHPINARKQADAYGRFVGKRPAHRAGMGPRSPGPHAESGFVGLGECSTRLQRTELPGAPSGPVRSAPGHPGCRRGVDAGDAGGGLPYLPGCGTLVGGARAYFALARRDPSSSRARRWASVRASSAGTFTSGTTPVPSQLVLVTGLMGRPQGTAMMKPSGRG
jgi:hypothetical protein